LDLAAKAVALDNIIAQKNKEIEALIQELEDAKGDIEKQKMAIIKELDEENQNMANTVGLITEQYQGLRSTLQGGAGTAEGSYMEATEEQIASEAEESGQYYDEESSQRMYT